MKWYSKIFFWEKHRIPLNILLVIAYYSGSWISNVFILSDDPYKRPDLMFYSIFLFYILLIFNICYLFSWILTLSDNDDGFNVKYKPHLKIIYIICASTFIILPLLFLINSINI